MLSAFPKMTGSPNPDGLTGVKKKENEMTMVISYLS
jgi:hypothetical protein